MQAPPPLELVERHVSSRAMLAILSRLRRAAGPEAGDAMVVAAGLAPGWIEDTTRWEAAAFLASLEREAARRLYGLDAPPDPEHPLWDLFREAGAAGLAPDLLGPLWPALEGARSPGRCYRDLPRWALRFLRTVEVSVPELAPGLAVVACRPHMGPDRLSLCRLRWGYLEAIPALSGLPPASVDHEECLHAPGGGAERCVYRVRFREPRPSWLSVGLPAAAAAAVVGAVARRNGRTAWRGAGAAALAVGLAGLLRDRRTRRGRVRACEAELLALLDRLDERYGEMQDCQARLWSLLHGTPDGIAIHDPEGRIRYANQALQQATGYRGEELRAMTVRDLLPLGGGRPATALAAGSAPYETSLGTRDGRALPVEVSASSRSGAEAAEGLLIVRDIRERRQAQEQIRQSNERLEARVRQRTVELEEANRELEAFARTVSHDLRLPLQRLGFLADLALQEESPAGHLLQIREQVGEMGAMMRALLELSLETGGILEKARVDLSGLALQVAEDLRRFDPGRRVEFEIQPGVEVGGDRNLLQALLENLLDNAWKFTRRVQRARIEFGASAEGGRVHAFVRDNGEGFDPKRAEHLFSPFARLHPAGEFEGTGIGLATARRVVTRHGGRIRAESIPGRGATFRFDLPSPEPGASP